MKYLKMLGLAAIASMAVMAFGSGSASATTLTCTEPAGVKIQCKAGTIMSASVETGTSMLLRAGFAEITCTGGTTQDKVSNTGSATETASGAVEILTFSNCGSATVDVLKLGSGEVHTQGATANNNGTLTGKETQVTVAVFGTSCVYGTSTGIDLGTVTGSSTTGGTAKIDVSANLPKISGGFVCANPAAWTATYKVTSPDWIDID